MATFACDRERYHPGVVCTEDPDRCKHWCCKVVYWNSSDGGATLHVSSEATPHIKERDYKHAPKQGNNSWEAGILGTHRPGGAFMPTVDSQLLPVRQGEAKSKYGGTPNVKRMLDRARNDPNAFAT